MFDLRRLPYREVWACDFEFRAPDGEPPEPHCMVARELLTGRELRLWADELRRLGAAPFDTGPEALFVAFYASAEIGCFLALGWPPPAAVLDLYVEFRVETNGLELPCGRGLLAALQWHRLDAMAADEKSEMRELATRGGQYTEAERTLLVEYCAADVAALGALLPRMLPAILARQRRAETALGHTLLRGRYMAAITRMERAGIPTDTATLARIRAGWERIKAALIREVDAEFGVYDGLSFRADRFAAYLVRTGTPWPRLPSGRLALDDDTFRDQVKAWPRLQPLRELRHALGELRLERLGVGADGRNRVLLSTFASRTGRNQPSNARFLFGPATWVRSLIRPEPGHALAYVDFTSQEMGIAAALSGDAALIGAYRSGDVYLAFAKQAGLAPPEATKASHGEVRDRCKAVVLGTLYGMQAETLARRIGRPPIEARELLRLHQATYRGFWRWSDATVSSAVLTGRIETCFGWRQRVGAEFNPRSLSNFPMQAHGAEMMRLAACLATERGIEVCAPVHDAFLIQAPAGEIETKVAELQAAMLEASLVVLGGALAIGAEARVIRWPDRYGDKRGEAMWSTVMRLINEL